MAINSYRVEAYLDSQELVYFRSSADTDSPTWLLFFGEKANVTVRLIENGECLHFSTLTLLHLDELSDEVRLRVLDAVMERNARITVGRYSGRQQMIFEAALPIEDGDVTDDQIRRMMGSVILEQDQFGRELRGIARGEVNAEPEEDDIDELMRKLLEGDGSG